MDGYNVSTMLKRLEAAASRLEDIVVYAEKRPRQPATSVSLSPKSEPVHEATRGGFAPYSQAAAPAVPAAPAAAPAAPAAPAASPSSSSAGASKLREQAEQLSAWVDESAKVDAGVAEQAAAFRDAALEMARVAELAGTRAKPELSEFAQILTPLNTKVALTDELRDTHRRNMKITNFLATVPSGAPALGWVSIDGKGQAAAFIAEMRDSAKFYGNRVLKDGKEYKPWVDQYIGFLESLRAIVESEYPEGLVWSASAGPGAVGGVAVGGGAPPPPPPPPPPSVEQLTANLSTGGATAAPAPTSSGSGGGMNGVFDELARGESIASTLKPVDRKALKSQKPPVPKSTKPGHASSAGSAASGAAAEPRRAKKHPRVELVESRWHIEDIEDRHDIEIQASMGQSVQIDNVSNSTIKILGKATTFSLSRSNKVGLLVDTMVASTDVVNCSNFGIQVTGTLPSIMIDQSQHGSIYLSEQSLGVEIFTSQTTAINVNIPEGEPGAYREVPLGEQIVHSVVNGSIKSSVVKHA